MITSQKEVEREMLFFWPKGFLDEYQIKKVGIVYVCAYARIASVVGPYVEIRIPGLIGKGIVAIEPTIIDKIKEDHNPYHRGDYLLVEFNLNARNLNEVNLSVLKYFSKSKFDELLHEQKAKEKAEKKS